MLPLSASPAGSAEEGYTQPTQKWDVYTDHSSGAAGGCEWNLREWLTITSHTENTARSMLEEELKKRWHLCLPMLSSSFIWQQIAKQCKEGCSHPSGAFSTLNSQQRPMLQLRSCTVLTLLADSNWGWWAYRRSWHSLNMIKKKPSAGSTLTFLRNVRGCCRSPQTLTVALGGKSTAFS